MRTLRTFVILARSLVILTIGLAGAAVVDSLLTSAWHGRTAEIALAK